MDRNRSVCLVGYALNPKKMRKSQTSAANTSSSTSERWQGGGLADILNENSDRQNGTSIDGVTFLAWDWTLPMHLQPSFDVIIHKLTDDLEKTESVARLEALKEYLAAHPSTVIVDPIESVRNVVSRSKSCEKLRAIEDRYTKHCCPFKQPQHFIADRSYTSEMFSSAMEANGLSFPVICKPITACGTPDSHFMVVAVSPAGLDLVSRPCLVQQYYNHNGNLFKVYVIGSDVMVFQRPSLPNLERSETSSVMLKSVAFDSRLAYPTLVDFVADSKRSRKEASDTGSASPGVAKVAVDVVPCTSGPHCDVRSGPSCSSCTASAPQRARDQQKGDSTSIPTDIPMDLFEETAQAITAEFGLTLFGFDVIVPTEDEEPSKKKRIVVIDVNYFPSYKEVSDFPSKLRSYLKRKAAAGVEEA